MNKLDDVTTITEHGQRVAIDLNPEPSTKDLNQIVGAVMYSRADVLRKLKGREPTGWRVVVQVEAWYDE